MHARVDGYVLTVHLTRASKIVRFILNPLHTAGALML